MQAVNGRVRACRQCLAMLLIALNNRQKIGPAMPPIFSGGVGLTFPIPRLSIIIVMQPRSPGNRTASNSVRQLLNPEASEARTVVQPVMTPASKSANNVAADKTFHVFSLRLRR